MNKLLTTIAAIAAATITAQALEVDYTKCFGAERIAQKYDENAIGADAFYRYKTAAIVGIVDDIGRDIMGNPYVVLEGSVESLGGVQCTFGTESEIHIAKLRKGMRVAVVGEIKGLVFFNVLVSDCQFTEIPVVVKKAVAANVK
jgi:tRNA_anti-like